MTGAADLLPGRFTLLTSKLVMVGRMPPVLPPPGLLQRLLGDLEYGAGDFQGKRSRETDLAAAPLIFCGLTVEVLQRHFPHTLFLMSH